MVAQIPISLEAKRAELEAVLGSESFTRAPTLAHLLSYLCEKTYAGESNQIKEYSIGLDVFHRGADFEQESDSIVRVQANRLRKRLAEYYAVEGAGHPLHITIPIGQYVPSFEEAVSAVAECLRREAHCSRPHLRRESSLRCPADRRSGFMASPCWLCSAWVTCW